MIKKILAFLFGTNANIFDDKGEVSHQFPREKWDEWHKRYFDKERADWRNHKGNEAKNSK